MDSDLKFTNIVARWPGSVHDSRIFQSSRLCGQLESWDIQGVCNIVTVYICYGLFCYVKDEAF